MVRATRVVKLRLISHRTHRPLRLPRAVLFDISQLLQTGLDRETLAVVVQMTESGVNPEALAAVIRELRRESAAMREPPPAVPAPPKLSEIEAQAFEPPRR